MMHVTVLMKRQRAVMLSSLRHIGNRLDKSGGQQPLGKHVSQVDGGQRVSSLMTPSPLSFNSTRHFSTVQDVNESVSEEEVKEEGHIDIKTLSAMPAMYIKEETKNPLGHLSSHPTLPAASKVHFGSNSAEEFLPTLIESLMPKMSKILLVQDQDATSDPQRGEYYSYILGKAANVPHFVYNIPNDSCVSVKEVNAGRDLAKRVGADAVVAFGGGSVLDLSRAIAALITNPGNAEDYIVDSSMDGKSLENLPAPHILLPTIAGSANELSTSSLIFNEDEESKMNFSKTQIIAECIIIDPMLTLTVPEKQSIEGALTAVGQCIESLFFQAENKQMDHLCFEGIDLVAKALKKPLKANSNLEDVLEMRKGFSLASLYSSAASISTGYGAAHSLGLTFAAMSAAVRHLEVCSAFMPAVFDQYTSLFEEDEDMQLLTNDILFRLNSGSNLKATSISEWFRLVSTVFKLRNANELGFDDDSMLKFVLDRTTDRMQEGALATHKNMLARQDIDAILKDVIKK